MNHLVNALTGDILVKRLLVRGTFWGRLRGLLFYRELEAGSAMLLVATNRVHTYGMLFPLDLYFLNSSMGLIEFQDRVLPWRLPRSPEGTRHILEIQHRTGTGPLKLDIGERVSILWKTRT